MHTRTLKILGLGAAIAITAGACGSSESNDESADAGADNQAEQTATTIATSACPTDPVLTITTAEGEVELEPTTALADVTLDASINVTIGNYEIAQEDAEGIYQPTLTGDDAAVIFYVSAAQGATLTPGTYVDVATEAGQYQFNSHIVYAPERVIATGFDVPEGVVEITEITETQVCGTISTGEVNGEFVADRI